MITVEIWMLRFRHHVVTLTSDSMVNIMMTLIESPWNSPIYTWKIRTDAVIIKERTWTATNEEQANRS